VGNRYADHVTPLYSQKLALTSPTGDGRSVGIVRSRTKATEFSLVGSTCFGCRRHPSSGAQYLQSRSVGTMCCDSCDNKCFIYYNLHDARNHENQIFKFYF